MKSFNLHVLWVAVVPFVSGCISVKIIADQQLMAASPATGQLHQVSIGFIETLDDSKAHGDLSLFISATQSSGVFNKAAWARSQDTWPDLWVTSFKDEHPLFGTGFQCFEPLLMVVSAGLVPAVCSTSHVVSFDLSSASGSSIHIEGSYTEKAAQGWFAFLLTASGPGKFSGSSAAYTRALFSTNAARIEQLAALGAP